MIRNWPSISRCSPISKTIFARTPENEAILARLLASLARRDGLNALDRDAVALVLEHAARSADHAGKLSLVVEQLREILIEADFCAREAKRVVISRADVDRALAARIRRAARLRDRAQEAILEKVALIDTAGAHVGQINGLSVIELGGFSFGRPTRITCQVRPGSGKVVDIEREVELGGPLHSKGVLILSGFLAGRYALDTPMSLFASLVFEQSYGGVEGDSASSAELYALLSALADAPLRQDLAVTGSVNQHGEIQAIGGVNEKIEGFFDICAKRGLTGTQGVLIPQANVQHLMLRKDVIEACAAGRFAVYPIATIDEGIALLTGLAAGERGADGNYPPDSVNRRIEDRLRAFASIRRNFASQSAGGRARQLAMPEQPHSFKRLVLGLQPRAPDRTMQLAVELADLLHLELLGLFLEDTSLRDLAGIPFAREFGRSAAAGIRSISIACHMTSSLPPAASSECSRGGQTASHTIAIRGRPRAAGRHVRVGLADRRHRHDRRARQSGRTCDPAVLLARPGRVPVGRRRHAGAAADRADKGPHCRDRGDARRSEHSCGCRHRGCREGRTGCHRSPRRCAPRPGNLRSGLPSERGKADRHDPRRIRGRRRLDDCRSAARSGAGH